MVFLLGGCSWVCGDASAPPPALAGRVVADGIPGAGTVTSVGKFLPGGPINDDPRLKAYTEPGKVLDPNRLLVGDTSNFGASQAVAGERPGGE